MHTVTYLDAIREGLWEEMQQDESVVLLGEDIAAYGGAFKVTDGFLKEFGADRVMDTPISESGIVGAAIGAAYMGLRPVCEMQFMDFISCAFDQIVNMAAKSWWRWRAKVPLVVRGPSGGGVRGGAYHSQNVEAWFCHCPGLKVVAPATPYDAKGLIRASIRDDNPVIYFEHKFLYRREKQEIPDEDFLVPLGQARVAREGRDATIITYGSMVPQSLQAAATLAPEGIEVEVVDLRTLVPLDVETVMRSVEKTSRALVVHEATLTGGVGAEVAARINAEAFEWLDAPVRRLASHDTPVPFSPPLEEAFMPQAATIADAVRSLAAY